MDVSSLWAEASEEDIEPSLPAPPSTPDRAQPQPQYAPSDVSSAATAATAPYPAFSNTMSAATLSGSTVSSTVHTTPAKRISAPPSTPAQPGPAPGASGGGGLVLVPSNELQLSGDLAAALEAELQEIERKYIDAELPPPRRSSPGSTRRWSAAQSPVASGGGAGAAAQRPSSVSHHYQLHPKAVQPLQPHHAHQHPHHAPHQHQHHQHHILHQRAEGYHQQHEPSVEAHAQHPLPQLAAMPAASTQPSVDAGAGLVWEPVPLPSSLLPAAVPGVPTWAAPAPGAPSAGAARSLLPMFEGGAAPGAGGTAMPGSRQGSTYGAAASHLGHGAAAADAQGGKPATDTLTQLLTRLQQQQQPLGPEQGTDGQGSPAVRALGQGLQTVHGAYDRLESRVRELRALVGGSPHSSAPPSTANSARTSPGRTDAGSAQALRASGSPAQRPVRLTMAASTSDGGARGAAAQGADAAALGVREQRHRGPGGVTGLADAALSNGPVGSATRALDLLLGLSLADGPDAASQHAPEAAAATPSAASTPEEGPAALGAGNEASMRAAATAGMPAHMLRSSQDGSSGDGCHATGSRNSTAAGMQTSGWVYTPTATSTSTASGGDASASLASEVTLRNTPQPRHAPQLSHLGERHRQQQFPSHMAPPLPPPQRPHQDHYVAASRPQQPQEEGRRPRISDADALAPLVGQGREEELQSGSPLSRALPDGGAAVMEARARLAAATAAGARTAATAAAARVAADDDAAREAARNQPPPPVFQTVLAGESPARVHGRRLGTMDAAALLPPAHVTSVIKPLLHLARDSAAAAGTDSHAHGGLGPGAGTQPPDGSRQADEQSQVAAAAAAAVRAEEEALELLEALEWSVAADAAALDDEFLAVLGRRLGHLDLAHGSGDGAAITSAAARDAAGPAAGAVSGFGGPAAAAVAAAMAAATGASGGEQGLGTEWLRAARQTALGAVQSRLDQLQARYASRRRHRRAASTSSAAARPEAMAAATPPAAVAGAAPGAGGSTASKGLRSILAQCASPSRHAAAGGTSSPAAAAAAGAGFTRSPRYGTSAAAAQPPLNATHPLQPAAARRLYASNGSLTPPPHAAASVAHASTGAGFMGSPVRGPGSQPPYSHHSGGRPLHSPPLFPATGPTPSPAASRGYSLRTSAPARGTAMPELVDAAAGAAGYGGSGPAGSAEERGLQLPPATTPEELEELRALCDMARHLPQLGPLERVQLWGRVGEVLAHKLARANPAVQQQPQQLGVVPSRPGGGSRYATPVKTAGPEEDEEEHRANGDVGSPGSEGRAAGQQRWGSIHSGGSPTRGYAAAWERRQNSAGSGDLRGRSTSPARFGSGSGSPGRQSPGAAAPSPTPLVISGAGPGGARLRLVPQQQRSPGAVAAPPAGAAAPGAGFGSPGGAALLDSTMEVVHRMIAPNATLAQAMSLNWKAVRTHLASQEAAASPQRITLSPKR
ncbi:hypothetical protein HXX76_000223 [Chlamydomonas incerta]|uniref:Uncharacterized protein n=1 Tax=Chlamydomonas incerta TaxID=51695 RepID=A0A836B2M7_CHLIN|nr:hypothetical protein HXX76_000223 [Chlamydomonas incerta]|eukprot:KAG2445613.1 hypothetical protein HXX76_000223 [Chlamydomonas incerta]